MTRFFQTVFVLTGCLLVASCGGGSVSASGGEGGISGTGIIVGRVASVTPSSGSGTAQIFVNGSNVEIGAQTQITVDEQAATINDLSIGGVVRIESDINAGEANRIDYVETVRGPLTSQPTINPDTLTGTLTVLGQSVTTDASTVFSNIADVSTLVVGDVLDVSGVRNANGNIVASFIERKSPPVNEYRVVGTVTNLTATTFTVGALIIDYSAADTSSLTGGVPVAGQAVRVRSDAATYNSGANTITATRVSDNVLSISASTDDSLELEGIVTAFTSLADFVVNGQRVNGANATIEGGTAIDIALNSSLEVEGAVDSGGNLLAVKIEIRPQNSVRIEADVDNVNNATGTLVALGITLRVDSNTQFEDDSAAGLPQFSLQNLSPGNRVEVRGYIDNGTVLLTRLERDDPDTDVRLQAPVDSGEIDRINQTVIIQGVTVSTDNNTDFEDASGMPLLAGQFFSLLMEGNIVKAKWDNFTGTNVPVDELSIEN